MSLRSRLNSILLLVILLGGSVNTLVAQTVDTAEATYWANIQLAHVEAKLLAPGPIIFPLGSGEVSIHGGLGLGPQGLEKRLNYSGDSLQDYIYGNTSLFDRLFEKLGGEFFIGSFSPYKSAATFRKGGVHGGYFLKDNLRAGVELSMWRSAVSSTFPVTVVQGGGTGGSTSTVMGEMDARARGINAHIGLTYFMKSPKLIPFFDIGIGVTNIKMDQVHAQIDGFDIPLHMNYSDGLLSSQVGAGLRTPFGHRFFVDLSAQVQIALGEPYDTLLAPAVQLHIGYGIGQGQ